MLRGTVFTSIRPSRRHAANLLRDLNFNGTIVGNVYAQPLYIEGGPNGPMIIVVTESNNVYALHANTGRSSGSERRYTRNVRSACGNIQSVRHHRNAGCRSRLAFPFL